MNISASNGLYLPPGSSLAATGGSARLKAEQAANAERALPLPSSPQGNSGQRTSPDKNLGATLRMMQGENVRGRLVDNDSQSPVARRALAAYTGTAEQQRREELAVLGIDVYA